MAAGLRKQEGDLATVLVFHTSGPGDIDNFAKSVHDGLNGLAWEDDRQVKAVLAVKSPCRRGQERTEIAVMPLAEFMERFGGAIEQIMLEAQAKRKGVRRSG
jgi:crossover junction endodeoxyribonuclease RusA